LQARDAERRQDEEETYERVMGEIAKQRTDPQRRLRQFKAVVLCDLRKLAGYLNVPWSGRLKADLLQDLLSSPAFGLTKNALFEDDGDPDLVLISLGIPTEEFAEGAVDEEPDGGTERDDFWGSEDSDSGRD